MKTKICLGLMVSALCLSGCGGDKLTRAKAEKILSEHIKSGFESTNFKICDNPPEDGFNSGYGRKHPCAEAFVSEIWLPLLEEYPIFVLQTGQFYSSRTNSSPYFKYVIGLNSAYVNQSELKANVVDIAEPNHHVLHVNHYRYAFGEVVGVRVLERAENDCDAIVEYTYERTDRAPWADIYISQIKKAPLQYEACFQKYDDGWRYNDQSE